MGKPPIIAMRSLIRLAMRSCMRLKAAIKARISGALLGKSAIGLGALRSMLSAASTSWRSGRASRLMISMARSAMPKPKTPPRNLAVGRKRR